MSVVARMAMPALWASKFRYPAVETRSFSPSTSMDTNSSYSSDQVELLGALTIAAATISVVAGSLSLFWFLRMRKAFRHHLIMLLIFSNLWRALWYFLFPVVEFARGMISPASPFCQISGFMLSYGIEGADFAVLVMAIHSALCIFHTSATLGESGLYPVRYVVFALWALLPALAGGLAFVNRNGGYTTSGAYCYLPIRPFWYRLALSWIPRYVVLTTIAVIYLTIYLFVRRNFHQHRLSEHSSDKMTSGNREGRAAKPGISSASESDAMGSRVPTLVGDTNPNHSMRISVKSDPENGNSDATAPVWENYTFGASTPLAKPTETETVTADPSLLKPSERLDSDKPRVSIESRESNTYIIQALRESQPATDTRHTTAEGPTTLRLTDSNDQNIEEATMRERHRQINRQMRFLFVYPVVYLISWIIPFVAHCLSYSDAYVRNPSFGLTVASTVILALQCAIDTILFTTREKPWRMSNSDDPTARTFTGSLTPQPARRHLSRTFSHASSPTERGASDSTAHRSLITSATRTASTILHIRSSHGGDEHGVAGWRRSHFQSGGAISSGGGRSRGQNVAEARVAQERKAAETAQARKTASKRRSQRKESLVRRGGKDRSWWEVEGRQRKDSVWLGTDTTADLERYRSAGGGSSAKTPIGEDDEGGGHNGLQQSNVGQGGGYRKSSNAVSPKQGPRTPGDGDVSPLEELKDGLAI